MITDIPCPKDFEQAGVSMLNLGWESVIGFYQHIDDADVASWDDDGRVTEEYWKAAQHPMSVALALVQQGVELLLKRRIAEVSPYLLLAGTPRDWPKGCDQKNVPFSDFRTIDSSELLRAVDAVSDKRVSPQFREQFEKLRRFRNVVLHGVDKATRPSGVEILRTVLGAAEELLGPRCWMSRRYGFIEQSPRNLATWGASVLSVLVPEGQLLLRLLKPAELKRYVGFDKKARAYVCYHCATECRDEDWRPNTAQLRANDVAVGATAPEVWCFCCDESTPVVHIRCARPDCKGDLQHEGTCLTCFEEAA